MMSSRKPSKRIRVTLSILLLVSLQFAVAGARAGFAQTAAAAPPPQKLSNELLRRLPDDLRGAARSHLKLPPAEQARWLALAPVQLRADALTALARTPASADFVLRHLPREPVVRNRVNLVRGMMSFAHWRTNPRLRQALANVVQSDPDASVIAQALDTLRHLEMHALRNVLEQRLNTARETGDDKLPGELAREHERWVMLERGSALPSFMRATPPMFALKPPGEAVRVLVFGDYGQGTDAQRRVAAAMLAEHRARPFDFGITTGDNFYPRGMESTEDPRWKTWWEEMYTPLGIRFYPSLGNHDWVNADSVAAELMYANKSESWKLLAPYYTYTAGPVQFFAVDTDEISLAQSAWLREELKKSTATWKVVYGHHPAYVSNVWGANYTEEARRTLWPIIKDRADVYFSGHHHSLQHLRPPADGDNGGAVTHSVTSGGGGAGPYPLNERDPLLLFGQSVNGFTALEADARALTFRHLGADGRELYSYTLRK